MRKTLAIAAVAAAAATLVPATSASAYCDPVFSALAGHCTNGCAVVGGVILTVQRTTGVVIIDNMTCPA